MFPVAINTQRMGLGPKSIYFFFKYECKSKGIWHTLISFSGPTERVEHFLISSALGCAEGVAQVQKFNSLRELQQSNLVLPAYMAIIKVMPPD